LAGKASGTIRRKNLRLDQAKLNRARRILGTRTETETVEHALDLVLFRKEVLRGVRRVAGTGRVGPVFDHDEEP
jgi:Arc/MetJ family transcription regulator